MLGQVWFLCVCLAIQLLMQVSCSSKQNYKLFKDSKLRTQDHLKTKGIVSGPTIEGKIGAFKDLTNEYGLEGVEATNLYAVDFNNDSYTDLVLLPNFYSTPEFYAFDPIIRKFQKLNYNPLPGVNKYSFLIFVDLNKDGVLDLLAGNLHRKTEITASAFDIYRGEISLKKVSYEKIETPFDKAPLGPSSVAVIDFDLDGELDLYLGNWFVENNKMKTPVPDSLYKGKGFEFKDVSDLLEGEHLTRDRETSFYNATPTYAVATCDINQDGWPDILTSSSAGFNNKLWMNQLTVKNQRVFQDFGIPTMYAADDEGQLQSKGGGNSFFSACFDYNNDQIMDVFLGELSHPYDYKTRDRSSILTGSQKKFPFKFLRSEFYHTQSKEDNSRCDKRAVFIDYNLDSREDVLVDNSGYPPHSRLILFQQNDDKAFADVAKEAGIDVLNPSGTVSLDINEDGLWDFITGQTSIRNAGIKTRIYVFQNQLERHDKRSLRFYLQGKEANRDGLGAMVILRTRDEVMRRWITYSYGSFPSQNEKGVIFGMEATDYPLLAEVRWPYKKTGNDKLETLSQIYNFNRLKHIPHQEITLCEDGAWHIGKMDCEF